MPTRWSLNSSEDLVLSRANERLHHLPREGHGNLGGCKGEANQPTDGSDANRASRPTLVVDIIDHADFALFDLLKWARSEDLTAVAYLIGGWMLATWLIEQLRGVQKTLRATY